MFLRSLAIKGFKSFARKTVLEFEPGVTIIVGPNGSGKSNIADAVMWVLGEQSPTSLRGNRMEDVIFSGSSSLRPVNMAEVSITLDNTNNDFPLDYSEVILTRNVVRGGDSEYRLNNTGCRLLDIQELLSDAGVGRTLNSVISQGNLDEVLTCRPEERRDYIEEAGGLLKYRKRREKAIRRLARMDEEILRTNDVAREVRRQLRPLQRQAGRLEEYQSLVKELNQARLRLDVTRLRAMQEEWSKHEEGQRERARLLAELDAEISEKAEAQAALEKAQSDWRARETSLRGGLYRLVSLHERLKAMLILWEEKARRVKEEEAALPAPEPAEIERLAGVNRDLEKRRDELQDRLEELKSLDSELDARVEEINAGLNELVRRRAGMEARLEVLGVGRADGAARPGDRLLEKKAELERLSGELEKARAEATGLSEDEAEASRRVAEVEGRIASLQSERASMLAELREAEGRQAGLAATLDILTRFETRTWSAANTSAALMDNDPTGGALGGMLVTSLHIDPAYETAIAGYLGPWLYGIVARDTGAIVESIEYLKRHGLGQGLFFKHGAAAPEGEPGPRIEGATPAIEAVEAPHWFGGALSTLLEGVYLATDLSGAVEMAERNPRFAFLTPEGDVITGGTLVKGGSARVSDEAVRMTAGRRRKLEEALASVREAIDDLDLRQAGISLETEDAEGELDIARRASRDVRDALERARSTVASMEARIDVLRPDVEDAGGADEEGLSLDTDPAELSALIEDLNREEMRHRQELARCEGKKRETAGETRRASSEAASVDRHLEIGRIKERDMRARTREARSPEGLPAIDEEDLAMLVALHERLVDEVDRARERARRDLDEGVRGEKEAAEGLRALREAAAQLQGRHEALRDQVHGEELAKAELKVRVEQLVDRITDEHKVPLDFAFKHHPQNEPAEQLQEKVEDLERQLEHVGPVNPEAIIERESLEQRYEFLKTQMDDVDKARAQLKRVIKQVDNEIQQKFSETLELVNGHFKQIFSTLFPNGSAELRLTDPEDLLSSGVEIMAQPEGKKLRRISLLSGGETSMTALAFFFSLFKVRPSPFYFLDEVEAALDDVNLHRFLDLVREFKGSSQLILITHQKRSMEIADILYGVTMQEDGMSRVLSRKVEEVTAS